MSENYTNEKYTNGKKCVNQNYTNKKYTNEKK